MTQIEMQAMESIKGIYREMKKANAINWEQRRYEIAKEIYPRVLDYTRADQMAASAKTTVFLADMIIAELKKEK